DRPGALGLLGRLTIDVSPLRESKPFRRLFVGQTISWFAGEITWIAVPYQLYQLTHSTVQVGLLYLTTLVPLLVAPIVGGAVADPAIGGLVIAAIGLTGTYLLDVGSFSASLASIWLLPKLPAAHDAEAASLRSIADGFRYVVTQKVVLGIFLVDTNAMIFGM